MVWNAPVSNSISLEDWLRSDSRSNFALSDQVLTPTTVGGQPAVAYRHSGLYETDAVALIREGQVYLFSAGWINAEDRIRTDFKELLQTVQFN